MNGWQSKGEIERYIIRRGFQRSERLKAGKGKENLSGQRSDVNKDI